MKTEITPERLTEVADLVIRAWRQGFADALVLTEDGRITTLEVGEALRFLRRLGVRRRDYC